MLFRSRLFFSPFPSGVRVRGPLLSALAGAGSVAALALLVTTSSPAQAGGTHWSIGISSPGVVVGVGNGGYRGGAVYAPPAPRYYSAPPGYYAPPPVYYAPAQPPVYYQPRPVYVPPPPVYFAPVARPIYYAPPVLVPAQRPYYGPGWRGQRHGERHHGYGYRD